MGKCAYPLQNMITNLDKLTMKHKEKDVIRILKNFKTVSIGIDYLGNKRVNYFNSLKYFANTRQGTLEGDNGDIIWERLEIETLILDQGCHVLFSPDITELVDQAKP